jgi:hypothetical protein
VEALELPEYNAATRKARSPGRKSPNRKSKSPKTPANKGTTTETDGEPVVPDLGELDDEEHSPIQSPSRYNRLQSPPKMMRESIFNKLPANLQEVLFAKGRDIKGNATWKKIMVRTRAGKFDTWVIEWKNQAVTAINACLTTEGYELNGKTYHLDKDDKKAWDAINSKDHEDILLYVSDIIATIPKLDDVPQPILAPHLGAGGRILRTRSGQSSSNLSAPDAETDTRATDERSDSPKKQKGAKAAGKLPVKDGKEVVEVSSDEKSSSLEGGEFEDAPATEE